MTMDVPD